MSNTSMPTQAQGTHLLVLTAGIFRKPVLQLQIKGEGPLYSVSSFRDLSTGATWNHEVISSALAQDHGNLLPDENRAWRSWINTKRPDRGNPPLRPEDVELRFDAYDEARRVVMHSIDTATLYERIAADHLRVIFIRPKRIGLIVTSKPNVTTLDGEDYERIGTYRVQDVYKLD